MLDNIDDRRTGHLDETQATAALRNMGLDVTAEEAKHFLETVQPTNSHQGPRTYSVEVLAQAISDTAAGQDRRHVASRNASGDGNGNRDNDMATILSAPVCLPSI